MKTLIFVFSSLPFFVAMSTHAAVLDVYDQTPDISTPKTNISGDSTAVAISADGNAFVGNAAGRAFRWASATDMQDLGSLKTDNSGGSTVLAISADGSTVVGYADNDIGRGHAFRWTAAAAMQDLGTLKADNTGFSLASAVSADGNTVVGESSNDQGYFHAFRWTPATATQDLGSLKGNSSATAVSADGSTVVGYSVNTDGFSRAFRWTPTTAMQDLGTLRADNYGPSSAVAISADGSTVVGLAVNENANHHAFRWTAATGMQDLGALRTGNLGESNVVGVSADGRTVVGLSQIDQGNNRAFRWTAATAMQDLGTLRNNNSGDSVANAISADGNTVVGVAAKDNDKAHAFRWTTATAMQDLGTLKADNSGYSSATSVSADGSTIVGNADNDQGETRAFIYRASTPVTPPVTPPVDPPVDPPVTPPVIPPVDPPVTPPVDPGVMQDYKNVLQSFSNLSDQIELAAAQQQAAVGRLLDDTCFVGEKGLNCLQVSGVLSNTGSDSDIGRRNQSQGLLTLGHGISENLTVGASVSSGSTRLHDSGINAKTAYGGAVWGQYSENGLARTGLQANVGVGLNTQDNDLARGEGLKNVQVLSGSADMTTVAGRIGVGYGFMHQSHWLITPSLALVQQSTTRETYSENRGAITGSYKNERLNATIVDVGTTAKKSINGVSSINLGVGVEYDLHADQANLEGTTDVPGMEVLNFKSGLSRNDLRPYMNASYSYDLSVGGTLSAGVRMAKDAYTEAPLTAISISYGIKF